MAWRIEAALALFAAAVGVSGAEATVSVRHQHAWKAGAGTLAVTEAGIRWTEPKEPKHDRSWSWSDIQQLELLPDQLRVLTYEDSRWKAGRDREYVLAPLPAGFAERYAAQFRQALGPKLVSAVPLQTESGEAVWELPVKLRERLGGSQGRLAFTGGELRYLSADRERSRVWPLADLELVASDGPYDLTLSTMERAGFARGPREVRFQLKSPLSREQYQRLWRAVQRANGLRPLVATPNDTEPSNVKETENK